MLLSKRKLNWTLGKCVLIIMLIAVPAPLIVSSSHATSPGKNIRTIEEKELDVVLYVISIISSPNHELVAIEFIWIPQEMKSTCIGISWNMCQLLDHKRYIDNQEGAIRGYPIKVMTNWVTPNSSEHQNILSQLSELRCVKELLLKATSGEYHLEEISEKYKVSARIEYVLWPNGQGFRVLKILDK